MTGETVQGVDIVCSSSMGKKKCKFMLLTIDGQFVRIEIRLSSRD